jgi:hypothetical protein
MYQRNAPEYNEGIFYSTSTPATTGVFIYLNIPRSLKNSIQYLAPSPTSTANLEPLSPPK